MSKQFKQKKGFTIIEVVLVLAIAGLIFLMVFFVLPQAMAGQRDTERRQAMSRVQSALVQYQTNNKSKRNNLPHNTDGTGDYYEFDESTDGEGFAETCDDNIACSFIKNYLNTTDSVAASQNLFIDPDGVPYNMVITDNWSLAAEGQTPNLKNGSQAGKSQLNGDDTDGMTITGEDPLKEHIIYVVTGAKCNGEYAVRSELRHFAVLYRLENSSVYCGDSD